MDLDKFVILWLEILGFSFFIGVGVVGCMFISWWLILVPIVVAPMFIAMIIDIIRT